MIDFTKYTDEKLRIFIWGYENIPSLHKLYTVEIYNEAIKERGRRIEKLIKEGISNDV